MADADRALREWVEELAMLYEREGLPRMAGRIFGWLLVCEPPEQTMEQLAAALQGSKASMSTMTRLLETAGLIARMRPPGARRDAFRILPDQWPNMWRSRMQVLSAAAALTRRGRALVAGRPPESRRRLDDIHDLYCWFEKEYPRLLSRWERERRPRRRPARIRIA